MSTICFFKAVFLGYFMNRKNGGYILCSLLVWPSLLSMTRFGLKMGRLLTDYRKRSAASRSGKKRVQQGAMSIRAHSQDVLNDMGWQVLCQTRHDQARPPKNWSKIWPGWSIMCWEIEKLPATKILDELKAVSVGTPHQHGNHGVVQYIDRHVSIDNLWVCLAC